jgi:hypothetical protein
MCVCERLSRELVTLAFCFISHGLLCALGQCSTQLQFIEHTVPTLGNESGSPDKSYVRVDEFRCFN